MISLPSGRREVRVRREVAETMAGDAMVATRDVGVGAEGKSGRSSLSTAWCPLPKSFLCATRIILHPPVTLPIIVQRDATAKYILRIF